MADWKKLAPDFEALARDFFFAEPDILIAKIDSTAEGSKRPAKEVGVNSFPEILFFPRGSKDPIRYQGERNFLALHAFLNEQTGAQWQVGGGLNDKAGTFEELNRRIAKLSDSNIAEVKREVQNAAKDIDDIYAHYYVGVLEELMDDRDFVANELPRLESALKEGGGTRSERDDLTRRVNVLRQFHLSVNNKDEL